MCTLSNCTRFSLYPITYFYFFMINSHIYREPQPCCQ